MYGFGVIDIYVAGISAMHQHAPYKRHVTKIRFDAWSLVNEGVVTAKNMFPLSTVCRYRHSTTVVFLMSIHRKI